MLCAFVFTFGVVGLTAAALGVLRSPSQSCLAALVLLGAKEFLYIGTHQYADMPLGWYFLTVMVLLSLKDGLPERPGGPAVLAGVAMGLAAWTKAEGKLFILAVLAVRWFWVRRTEGWRGYLRELGLLACGCIPVFLAVLVYHLRCVPPQKLMVAHGQHSLWLRFLEGWRYVGVAWGMVRGFFTWGEWKYNIFVPLALYALLMGVSKARRSVSFACPWAVVLLMCGGYALFYVLIPLYPLVYMKYSWDRLLLQLWPLLVLGYFFLVNTPEEALAEAAAGRERTVCRHGSAPE
jgi:hypothetical protein